MITRRSLFPLLAAGSRNTGVWAQGSAPPNIVLIAVDDLGYGDLGCYGHPTLRTPNIDRMAAEGVRFTSFYSGAPVCTPSRAALLTGRLPVRSGMTSVLNPLSTGGLPGTEVTLAESLKSAGYRTGCVGKWHLGHQAAHLPLNHGFDTFFGIPYSHDLSPRGGPGSLGYPALPPLPLMRNTETIETDPDHSLLTRRFTEEAVRFVLNGASQPFFLFLSHPMPHVPLAASPEFRGRSTRGLYGDVVEELDWSAGAVLNAVKSAGKEQNTLFLFSSDNGPWLSKRQLGGSSGPLHEGKLTTWEGGPRVPFIARWMGSLPPGQTVRTPASFLDLFPTLVRLGGAALPPGVTLDGEDISPLLQGETWSGERTIFFWNGDALRAMRKGPWKLHVEVTDAETPPAETTRPEQPLLFNVESDPGEKYNVAALYPEVVADLQQLFDDHASSVTPGPPQR